MMFDRAQRRVDSIKRFDTLMADHENDGDSTEAEHFHYAAMRVVKPAHVLAPGQRFNQAHRIGLSPFVELVVLLL